MGKNVVFAFTIAMKENDAFQKLSLNDFLKSK